MAKAAARFASFALALGLWIAWSPVPGISSVLAQDVAPTTSGNDRLMVVGLNGDTKAYELDQLRLLPATNISVYFGSSHGPVQASFQGVQLWTILQQARLTTDGGPKNEILRRTVTITGADGYQVVLSAGELAPSFGGGLAILAYEQDGKPLRDQGEGFARLIVPGDKLGGRNVSGVVRIQVQ